MLKGPERKRRARPAPGSPPTVCPTLGAGPPGASTVTSSALSLLVSAQRLPCCLRSCFTFGLKNHVSVRWHVFESCLPHIPNVSPLVRLCGCVTCAET